MESTFDGSFIHEDLLLLPNGQRISPLELHNKQCILMRVDCFLFRDT